MSFTSQPKNSINYSSKYVSKEVINHVPTLMPQAPNRKGNQSKNYPENANGKICTYGSTNVTANKYSVSQPKGNQGAPKADGQPLPSYTSQGVTLGKSNAGKPKVSRPPANYGPNDAYRKGSSYLK